MLINYIYKTNSLYMTNKGLEASNKKRGATMLLFSGRYTSKTKYKLYICI